MVAHAREEFWSEVRVSTFELIRVDIYVHMYIYILYVLYRHVVAGGICFVMEYGVFAEKFLFGIAALRGCLCRSFSRLRKKKKKKKKKTG